MRDAALDARALRHPKRWISLAAFLLVVISIGPSSSPALSTPAGNPAASGTVASGWVVAGARRLVFSPGGPLDSVAVFQPYVLRAANGSYLMYYTGYDGFRNHLMVAISPDGIVWTRVGEILFLNDGSGSPFVLRIGGMYHIWFNSVIWGLGPMGYTDLIYHSTSPDGLTWSGATLALGVGNVSDWDGGSVGDPSVVRDASGAYRMYFTMYAVNRSAAIGVAISTDLLGWTKWSGNPVLLPGAPGSWNDVAVANPSALLGSNWTLFFHGLQANGTTRIGVAASADGYHWVQESAPLLLPDAAGTWDSRGVGAPSFLGAASSPVLYFDGSNGSGSVEIGSVPLEDILTGAPGATSWSVSAFGFRDGGMDRLDLTANLSLALGPFRPATPTPTYSGTYRSAVFDSGANGTVWQSLSWTGDAPANATVGMAIRVGNTSVPDASWTPWANLTGPGASQPPWTIPLDVPRYEFVQFGITMTSNGTSIPWVGSVTVSFGRNGAPAVTLSVPTAGAWTNVSSPVLAWTASDPNGDAVIATVVELSQASNFSSISMTSGVLPEGTDAWQVAGSLSEGQWYWRVQAEDAYGFWGAWSAGSFNVDVTPPTLSVTTPIPGSLFDSGSVGVAWIVQDSGSGVAEVHVRVDNGTPLVVSAGLPGIQLTGLADGNHTIAITAVDRAGNTQTLAFAVRVDTTAPGLAITSPATGTLLASSSLNVTWTAADAGSGIRSIQVSVDGGAAATLPAGTRSLHLAGLADGAHTVLVTVVDQAGNTVTASVSVSVDTTSPQLAIVSPISGAPLTASSVDVGWVALDSGSGIESARISLDGGAALTLPVGTSTIRLTGLSDGAHTITVTVVDRAGNPRSASISVTVDTNPLSPSGPLGWTLIGVIVMAIALAAVASAWLVLRRRRNRPPSP